MAAVPPLVKGVYVCDEVLADSATRKISLLNSFVTVRPPGGYPHELGRLCVLVALRGGRGSSRMRVDVVRGETGGVLFRTAERDVRFIDPLLTIYVVFRLEQLRFPAPGRYTVEVHCDGTILDDEVITFLPAAGGG